MKKLTGIAAINAADATCCNLYKYADPTDDAREVTVEEAREIAREDASLLFFWVYDGDHGDDDHGDDDDADPPWSMWPETDCNCGYSNDVFDPAEAWREDQDELAWREDQDELRAAAYDDAETFGREVAQ